MKLQFKNQAFQEAAMANCELVGEKKF